MSITKETIVTIEYVLTNAKGTELDSSKGRDPLVYFHGAGHLVSGLEVALEGKSKGDVVDAVVPPAAGYGERDETMVQDVPRDRFPEEMELEVGTRIQTRSPAGVKVATVVAIEEDHVRLDANHPLAGIHLHFHVTVLDVRPATPEEVTQAYESKSCSSGSC